MSCQGSVLANEIEGASILGRGDLAVVVDVQLREVEVVIGLVCRGLGLLTWLPSLPSPFPIHFPLLIHPLPLHSSFLIPPGGPCIHWVQCQWVVVVDMKEIEVAVQGHSCALRFTEFLTPFLFVCLAAPSTNSLNSSKYFFILTIHIQMPSQFYWEW